MRRYSKPTTVLPSKAPVPSEPAEAPVHSFDVVKLLEQAGTILTREIRNLMSESAAGKLSPTASRDLVAYLKLLHELKKAEEADAANLTDSELLALSKNSNQDESDR